MDAGRPPEAVPEHHSRRDRRRLRQADRAGRRHGLRGRPDGDRTPGRRATIRSHRHPGRVRTAAGLEDVPTVLRGRAGRLPQRVR